MADIAPAPVRPRRKTTWRGAITGRDNVTLDVVRMLLAFTGPVFLGLEVYSVVWLRQPVNFYGMSALLGAGGISLGVKGHTEPEPERFDEVQPRLSVDRGP